MTIICFFFWLHTNALQVKNKFFFQKKNVSQHNWISISHQHDVVWQIGRGDIEQFLLNYSWCSPLWWSTYPWPRELKINRDSVLMLLNQLFQLFLFCSHHLVNNFAFLHQYECWHRLHLEFLSNPLFTIKLKNVVIVQKSN